MIDKNEAKTLLEMMEWYIFEYIRNDSEIDNIAWLESMIDAYRKLKMIAESEG